jgi:hypothetical protein
VTMTTDASTLASDLATLTTTHAACLADAKAAISGSSSNKRSALSALINELQAAGDDLSAINRRLINLTAAASLDAAS